MKKLTHENSLLAYRHGRLELFPESRRRVIEVLKENGRLTDRQINDELDAGVANTRPRVSELIKLGIVRECGSQPCEVTGKTVRVVQLVPLVDPDQLDFGFAPQTVNPWRGIYND